LDEKQLLALQKLEEIDEKERLHRLLSGDSAALLMQQPMVPGSLPAAPGGLSPEAVNQALRQKSLPPLSPQEMKLLQEVNGKIAQASAGQGAEIPPELLAAAADPAFDPKAAAKLPKAAVPNGPQPLDPAAQKALAAKGLDPRKLKAAEAHPPAASGTPEKILPTETYLQMHESANAGVNAKHQPKDLAAKGAPAGGAEHSAASRAPEAALTAAAVAGVAQKGGGSRKGDDLAPLPEGAKQAKLDSLAAGGFGAALAQKTEAAKHDIYLPGPDKPEQMKSALLAEVGSGVALHAHQGGGEMRLVIHPDDLGEVKLKVGTKNGKVEVQVTAENEDVAMILRGGSKELEASLKDQNLSLTKFDVTVSDSSTLVPTDTKSGLNEQFLSQNQQHNGGFAQNMGSDDGRNARWGGDQGGRQGGGYSALAEDSGRSVSHNARSLSKTPARATDSSRRLDVVA
jgi:flagellar hook-length control protein FliK